MTMAKPPRSTSRLRAVLGSGAITIRDFDLAQGKSKAGYLGITLKRELKSTLATSKQSTPYSTAGGAAQNPALVLPS